MWLTQLALRTPSALTLFFIGIAIFGLTGYRLMGRNLLPAIGFHTVSIAAPFAGAGPQELERLVIQPIEDRVAALDLVERVSASARNGGATIVVRFPLASNVDADVAAVQAAVDAARGDLPPDLPPPSVAKIDTASAPILRLAVSSAVLEPADLSRTVERMIVPRLRSVRGVGAITPSGALTRQFRVEPQSERLAATGTTALDIEAAVRSGNLALPGGILSAAGEEAALGVRADVRNAADIARLPLASGMHIGDIARVVDGFADARIRTSIDGSPAILLDIARDPAADAAGTTARVRRAIAALAPSVPLVRFRELHAEVTYTLAALDGVMRSLFEGIVLTAIVVLFFLHAWRNAVVAMAAIPASLLATFLVMWLLGLSLDVLSLMGLSLVIGVLVDDSIVIIENITRHYDLGRSAREAALLGRSEIGGAALAITLVDVVVFAPIAFASGLIGQFMREFAIVVVVSTLFSLLVSFTLTPFLAAVWSLRGRSTIEPRSTGDRFRFLRSRAASLPWLLRAAWLARVCAAVQTVYAGAALLVEKLRNTYAARVLPQAMRRPRTTLTLAAVACAVSFIPLAAGAIPAEFSPYGAQGEVTANLHLPAGTPIAATQRVADELSATIGAERGVRHVATIVGTSGVGSTQLTGGNLAQIIVALRAADRGLETRILLRLKELARERVPGALLRGSGTAMGGAAPINYALSGPPQGVEDAAQRLVAALRASPFAGDLQTSVLEAGPRYDIALDRERATLLGVTPQDVAQTAHIATGGELATRVRTEDGLVDTVIRLPSAERSTFARARSLAVRARDRTLVPLSALAHFVRTSEPALLQREDRERVVSVTANTTDGAPIGLVTRDLAPILRSLPAGVSVKGRGDIEGMVDATRTLGVAALASSFLVYALLCVLYRGYVMPLVILTTVPLAAVGAFGALWLMNVLHAALPEAPYFAGQTLNFYSMLGLLMLMGLVAKNGILLVEYAQRARRAGVHAATAMTDAARARFRPIVMTTVAMIAGMTPLALGVAEGAELRKALGTVLIGGLASSLFLTLLVVPALYVLVAREREALTPITTSA